MTEPIRLAPSYRAARSAFLDSAGLAGARIESHPHPRSGPAGEQLAIDVAELGPSDARDVVVVVSGTHGVEGYCGSALQTQWLRDRRAERRDRTRLVFVHAFNPYGFAWVRRVNEDNVDLNRNFVDWGAPPPSNPRYAELAETIVPREWTSETQQRTTLELLAVAEEVGFAELQEIISGGQYDDPTGVFYGGSGPVWSHRWLLEWGRASLSGAERLLVLDLHTGLGPWGVGELISGGRRGEPMHQRATELWGEVTSIADGDSVSAVVVGDWLNCAASIVPDAELTAAAIEYGTVDPISVLQALRADAWLHSYGDPTAPDAEAVRAQVRAAFADDDPAWIQACWVRFDEVIGAALGR